MCNYLKFKNRNFQPGISLIEIVVVIVIIAIFSTIIIADFPRILKNFALSRATYKLAQDLRKTQDLGLSGLRTHDSAGNEITSIKGYGIYVFVDPNATTTNYVVYADLSDVDNDLGSKNYDGPSAYIYCTDVTSPSSDCILDEIDVSKENKDLYIKRLVNTNQDFVSINFSPPDFVNIDTKCVQLCDHQPSSEVGIVLGLLSDNSAERTVWVNTSGLVKIE
ncbi:MAG: prepilin-type N-terminal cleavage/methylation domain-containing protein [Candidatus Staskawiczbacteria bacterium]|nr:prepilin-type N-terminal cleavage/methylation domain-containing protein [Candidatus Staskawiczbacteria bacterium]